MIARDLHPFVEAVSRRRFLMAAITALGARPLIFGDDPEPNDAHPARNMITPDTQRAIERGLEYLAGSQFADGAWGDRALYRGNLAVVSLCGLAFLAGGHHPGLGPYGKTVTRAIQFILAHEQSQPDGFLHNPTGSMHGPMYSHGFATMFLAEAVGDAGRVVTIEVGQEFAEIASENFRVNGLESRIKLINADVTTALSDLQNVLFDLVFLDGDKGNYGALLHPLLDRLRVGGLMIVDDIFCNGDTLNAVPTTDKGAGVRELLEKVAELDGYDRVILPYGNGQLFLRKY